MRKLRRKMPRGSNGKSERKKSRLKTSNKSVNLFIKALVQKKGGKVFPKRGGLNTTFDQPLRA